MKCPARLVFLLGILAQPQAHAQDIKRDIRYGDHERQVLADRGDRMRSLRLGGLLRMHSGGGRQQPE